MMIWWTIMLALLYGIGSDCEANPTQPTSINSRSRKNASKKQIYWDFECNANLVNHVCIEKFPSCVLPAERWTFWAEAWLAERTEPFVVLL